MTHKPLPVLNLKPSKLLALWLAIVHLGASICILVLNCAWQLKAVLFICCLLHAVTVWRYPRLTKQWQAINKLLCLSNGDWVLIDKQNRFHRCQITQHSVITRFLLLLHFFEPAARCRFVLVLLPDTLTREDFRRLQVYILTHR